MSACCPCPPVSSVGSEYIDDITVEWDDLLQRSYDNRIFLSPLWFRTWLRHNRATAAHVLVHRSPAGDLTGVLPLQVTPEDGERVLSLLGDWNVADYMDGAAEKENVAAILPCLWESALQELTWDRVELRHVPSASPLIGAIEAVAGDMGLEITVDTDEVCPVAILCNTWDGYLQMLTKKQRHEIRRKVRRCEEGAQVLWRISADEDSLDNDLEIFFQLHEASAHDKAGFMTAGMRDFFRDIGHQLFRNDILRLGILERDGKAIAATMGFLHRDRYLLYNSGYDPEEAARSPGIAAVSHAMQDAIGDKAAIFDFLSGDEPYKYQFGAQNTYTCRVTVRR